MPRPRPSSTMAVIVHFGPVSSTRRTLASLTSHASQTPVVVVDNDGALGSSGLPHDGDSFALLSPGRNLGYGAACNLAARDSSSDYLLLLNNDVELRPGTLQRLVDVLDEQPDVAVVGPALLNGEGRSIASIGCAPTPRRVLFENLFLPRLLPGIPFFRGHHTARISHRRARDVETLQGAVFLIRRAAFEQVGGFDERYFFFVEETDLFERLRRRGWRIRFDPACPAIHHGGVASRGIDQEALDRWLHQGFRAYARAFHGAAGERLTVSALYVGAVLRWLLSFVQLGPARHPRRRRYAAICRMYRDHRRSADSSEEPRGEEPKKSKARSA